MFVVIIFLGLGFQVEQKHNNLNMSYIIQVYWYTVYIHIVSYSVYIHISAWNPVGSASFDCGLEFYRVNSQSMAFGLSGSWETSMRTEQWLLFTCQHKTTLAIGLDAFGCRWANRVSHFFTLDTKRNKVAHATVSFCFVFKTCILLNITCWNDSTLCIQNLLRRSWTTQLISKDVLRGYLDHHHLLFDTLMFMWKRPILTIRSYQTYHLKAALFGSKKLHISLDWREHLRRFSHGFPPIFDGEKPGFL